MKKNKNTCIGSIGKPRGLKGEFFLNSYCSPEKNIINYIDNVRLEDNSRIQLKYIKTNNSKFIAKIEGINDVELVKEYTNEKIYITLIGDINFTKVIIEDDGEGMLNDDSTDDNHFGLSIMKERANSIGASLAVESEVGEGTRVLFELDLKNASDSSL